MNALHNTKNSTEHAAHALRNTLLAGAVALALSACAIDPQPLTSAEQKTQIRQDQNSMFSAQEPITKPLTLAEAMARAVKYNLDNRLKMMEEAVAQHQFDLSKYDMLPRLTVAAGYADRNSYAASSSEDVFTNQQSLAPSTSSDRAVHNADLGFAWNILDFGVSYYQAQEQGDRLLILKERRRKVVHSMMQQVRQAYWMAQGAQQAEQRVRPMYDEVSAALTDLRKIKQEKLRSPKDILNEERHLLDMKRQLGEILADLAQAKPRLAALMNVDPRSSFTLDETQKTDVPAVISPESDLVETALEHRPDLVEARYNERISVTETKKAMAKLMPGLELDFGEHYDSNSFLVNSHWADVGIHVTWNIFNLLSAKQILATADAQVELAKMQRMALNMAVMSQVYISCRDYQGRVRQYELASDLDRVDHEILTQTMNEAKSDAQGKLPQIRAELNVLYSDLRVQQNYGALQNAYGAIMATLGVDPLPETMAGTDLASLTAALEQANRKNIDSAALTSITVKTN